MISQVDFLSLQFRCFFRIVLARYNSGVEERYLGRLITSRPRFDSGPRNKNTKPPSGGLCVFVAGRKQKVLLSTGIEKRSYVALATGEFGEEVLNERSEFRNLTPIPGPATRNVKDSPLCESFTFLCDEPGIDSASYRNSTSFGYFSPFSRKISQKVVRMLPAFSPPQHVKKMHPF